MTPYTTNILTAGVLIHFFYLFHGSDKGKIRFVSTWKSGEKKVQGKRVGNWKHIVFTAKSARREKINTDMKRYMGSKGHLDSEKNEPPHDKTNKMICGPSEDSDQPGHLFSLIIVLPVRMNIGSSATHWAHCKDWSDWAHMPFCWFCHEVAQI